MWKLTIAFARPSEGQGMNRTSYTIFHRGVLNGNLLMQRVAGKVWEKDVGKSEFFSSFIRSMDF